MVKAADFFEQSFFPTHGKVIRTWIADVHDLKAYLRDNLTEKYDMLFEGENSLLITNELVRLFTKEFNDGMLLLQDENHPNWTLLYMKNRDGKLVNHSLLIVEDEKLRILTRTAEICYHKIVDGIETYNLQ